jgi:hypothetical protein
MKLLLATALFLFSLSSCASTKLNKGIGIETDAIVVQKAQESGIAFISNGDQYQLISGGRAFATDMTTSGISASQSHGLGELLWEGVNGTFDLTISSQNANQQNAQVLSNSTSYRQIAYNQRTEGIAIITGQIIVTYTAEYDATFIATNFGIQLIYNFPHLNTAFYTLNPGQDIFLMTNSLNQSGIVSSAEVEVMENFAMPN